MILYKYHSCNNIFLITNYKNNLDYNKLSKEVCNMYASDGLIVFKNDPMKMNIYNKDGSEAMMCGNGISSLVNYLYDLYGIYNYFEIETNSGLYECEIICKNPFKVKVSLGIGDELITEKIRTDNKGYKINLFTLGVKHAVYITEDLIESIDAIKIFEYYKGEYNVNIVKLIDDDCFEILTYEKGVGFTQGCGTGASASAYILYSEYNTSSELKAISHGGIADIIIDDQIYLVNETSFIERVEL